MNCSACQNRWLNETAKVPKVQSHGENRGSSIGKTVFNQGISGPCIANAEASLLRPKAATEKEVEGPQRSNPGVAGLDDGQSGADSRDEAGEGGEAAVAGEEEGAVGGPHADDAEEAQAHEPVAEVLVKEEDERVGVGGEHRAGVAGLRAEGVDGVGGEMHGLPV